MPRKMPNILIVQHKNIVKKITIPQQANVMYIKNEPLGANMISGTEWDSWDKPYFQRTSKKSLEIIQKDGFYHVQLVHNLKDTEGEEKFVNNDLDKRKLVHFDLRPAQNVTLRSVSDDVLISHSPGKGKTFSAILKAEKKRRECLPEKRRILIVAPKASILAQWQQTVIKNNFDPRNYIFMTNALFRSTFTTGRYPLWENLDKESKDMVLKKCWSDKNGSWEWNGSGDHVDEYMNQIVANVDDLFVGTSFTTEKTRAQVFRLIVGSRQVAVRYLQDTITNKYVHVNKIILETETNSGNRVNDLDKYEDKVLNYIVANPHFYRLYQEHIFFHYDEENDKYYFFTNLKVGKRIQSLEREQQAMFAGNNDDNDDFVADLEDYNGVAPFAKRKFKDEKDPGDNPYNPDRFLAVIRQRKWQRKINRKVRSNLSKIDCFRDFKRLLSQYGLSDVKSVVIDKFINKQHGTSLSQHRYQPERKCIFVLDEAHQPEAITDNLYKVSAKIMLSYAKTCISRIMVTATPMQSERPLKQLWNFAKLFEKKDYEETVDAFDRKDLKQHFEIISSLQGKISRSFDMQPMAKKLFIESILKDDFLLQNFDKLLSLHNWGNSVTVDVAKNDREGVIRDMAESMIPEVKTQGFENPFPTLMKKLTMYDKGYMAVFMDQVRSNICRYAYRDDDSSVFLDYRTRRKSKKYQNDTTYDQYADNDDPLKYFDKDLSNQVFEKTDKKIIPIVMNRCSYDDFSDLEKQEVDARMMEKLQKYAFDQTDSLIVPILADKDKIEEAMSMLSKHVIRRFKKSSYRNQSGEADPQHNYNLRRAALPRVIQDYIEEKKREQADLQLVAKWMEIKPMNNKMPFIPELMSSKYREIVNTMIRADREHTNGMVFHRNIETHYELSRHIDAFGGKLFNFNEEEEDEFLDNACKKILNKFKAYKGLRMFDHKKREEVEWSPTYEIERLKNWGNNGDNDIDKPPQDGQTNLIELHRMIKKLGKMVEEKYEEQRNEEATKIEYVIARGGENKYYVKKAWKLEEPVTISEYGKYKAIDDNGNIIELYEGRNGKEMKGPTYDYDGDVIETGTAADYKYYKAIITYEDILKLPKPPKISSTKIRKPKLFELLTFSMQTYNTNELNPDNTFSEQKELMRILTESYDFKILENYTESSKETTRIKINAWIHDIKPFYKNGNKLYDVIARQVLSNVVSSTLKYKATYPSRPFSQIEINYDDLDEEDFQIDEIDEKIKEIYDDLEIEYENNLRLTKIKKGDTVNVEDDSGTELDEEGVITVQKEITRKKYISIQFMQSIQEFHDIEIPNSQERRLGEFKKVYEKCNKEMQKQWEDDVDNLNDNPTYASVTKLLNNPYIATYVKTKGKKAWKYKDKIMPEIVYAWYKRRGTMEKNDDKEIIGFQKMLTVGSSKNAAYMKRSYFSPYLNEGIEESDFKIYTYPSNEDLVPTLKKMQERLLALESDTFLTYMFYNGSTRNLDRDLVVQALASGMIDWILISEAGITGVDFKSLRRSLMILVSPTKSPGLEAQFTGRLARNESHGLIPKLFQRTEYLTFYNTVLKSKDSSKLSRREQPYRYFNGFKELKEEYDRMKENANAVAQQLREEENYFSVRTRSQTKRTINEQIPNLRRSKRLRKAVESPLDKEIENELNGYFNAKNKILEMLIRLNDTEAQNYLDDKPRSETLRKKWQGYEDKYQTTKAWQAALKDYDNYIENKRLADQAEFGDDVPEDELPAMGEDPQQDSNNFNSKETKEEDEKKKKKRPGGKLHILVDSKIDNHVLVSAVVAVNNHVFSTVQQYLEHDLQTPYDKRKTKPFGWACHFCHYENDLDATICSICNKERNKRYYKMETEYSITDQIGDSEYAIEREMIYPEAGRVGRYVKSNGNPAKDSWTREENFMWNKDYGYYKNTRLRDQLLFMLGMVSVERYFKQQKKNLVHYTTEDMDLYVKTTTDTPYGWENRTPTWDQIMGQEAVNNTDSEIEDDEQKIGDDERKIEDDEEKIEQKYQIPEDNYDFLCVYESEYSD